MVYVLLGTGFEEIEALTPVDLLRRADIPVMTVGISGKTVYGSHGVGFVADLCLQEVQPEQMELLVLPGGLRGVASIQGSAPAMELIRRAFADGKLLGAICAAPTILAGLGILQGRQAVCYPGCEAQMGAARVLPDKAVVQDGNIITGASAGCATPFALALIAALRGEAEANRIAQQIVMRA